MKQFLERKSALAGFCVGRIGIRSVGFLWRKEKKKNSEKNPRSKARTNNKLNPHMAPGPGMEPGTHWWEASALTTTPSLLPKATNETR